MVKKTGLSILTAVLLSAPATGAAIASSLFSTGSPAVATASNGKIYMVYRGADTTKPNALFWAESNGVQWTERGMVAGQDGVLESFANPAIAFFDQKIQLVYQTVEDSSSIYWASLDPTTGKWTDHKGITAYNGALSGDLRVVCSPAVTVVNGKLYLIYQGQKPDNTLYWASYQNGRWTNLMEVDAVP